MPAAVTIVLSLAIGYVLGGIPFAAIVGRLRGVDIMKVDTGNPGAANVFRQLGRRYGLLVGAADMGKAALAVLVARWLGLSPQVAIAAGAVAILGHWYSPFLRFKGGAGLATAVGVGFGVVPDLAAIGVATALMLIAITRNVGKSAAAAYVVVAVVNFALPYPVEHPWGVVVSAIGVAAVVWIRAIWKDWHAPRGRSSVSARPE